MRVLCLDPSGNWGDKEGNGTTGWALFDDGELAGFSRIDASKYTSQEQYWLTHKGTILGLNPQVIVCESYNLQGNKAKQQTGSSLDTPQLIGYLRMLCYEESIDWVLQHPQDKVRVADPILERMGVLEKRGRLYYCNGLKTVIHERDAIRHGIFYHRFGKGKLKDGTRKEGLKT